MNAAHSVTARTLGALAFMALLLAACGSTQRIMLTTGPPIALLRLSSGTEIVPGACDTSLSSSCERAERTNNPKDEEAWQLDAQTKLTGPWGAKVGTAPMKVYVLGSREKCDALYATWPHPNDPCTGPFYFRRG